jgi:predicted NAD/FAD-binding protein
MSKRIAVIGGGIAGLGAAWLLSQRYKVTLMEAAETIGGHTNTVDVPTRDGPLAVDTGFIVYNEPNYPHLTALFRHLGVATKPSDMSFAFAASAPEIEYAGDHLGTVFAQPRNLLRPAFWGMVIDILRFNRRARAALAQGVDPETSLGELLDAWGLGEGFRRFYLLPMSAAIWSCPPERILEFPARAFLQFFRNHGLIQVTNRPQWRTVDGGGRTYVQRMLEMIGDVRAATPVQQVQPDSEGVVVATTRYAERFDEVVIATHADQALRLLQAPSSQEAEILGAFGYAANEAWLHTDQRLMPRRRRVWASWNHLTHEPRNGTTPVSVTYWMNRLQSLATEDDIFVSLNPPEAPDPERVHRRFTYEHPVFDAAAVAAQERLAAIQGQRGLWFCGSYCGYGFHEDALQSAVDAAAGMGVATPWPTDREEAS